MWLRHRNESDLSVQLVGISGAEEEEPNPTNFGMVNRCRDDECPETLAPGRIIYKDVAQPTKGRSVSDPSCEGNLPTRRREASEADRVLNRLCDNLNGAILCPIAFFAEPPMNQGQVEPASIVRDHVTIVPSPVHAPL